MDKDEILNTLGEVQYELAKVKRKLDNLVSQLKHNSEVHPELDGSVHVLQRINNEMYETILIEKWGLIHSIN